MRMKASAYKQYGDAAVMALVLEALPQVKKTFQIRKRKFAIFLMRYGHIDIIQKDFFFQSSMLVRRYSEQIFSRFIHKLSLLESYVLFCCN